jgi:hypothetical protein
MGYIAPGSLHKQSYDRSGLIFYGNVRVQISSVPALIYAV